MNESVSTTLSVATPYASAFFRGLQPDPRQLMSEWAEEHFVLPRWSAEPGKFRLRRTPYLRGILDALSPLSPFRRIVFMKCTQVGATTVGQIWSAHTIHRAPTTMLIVEPTIDMAQKISKQRIATMLRDVSCLGGLVAEAKSRDGNNTILAKEFDGGMLVIAGANSGTGLRFMSAKHLFEDEVDAYPADVDGEGPPGPIVEERTNSYATGKIYLASTPLEKSTSVIEPEYEASNKQRFHVPCPFCSHEQHLCWKQLKWPEGRPDQATYECEACHTPIPEHHKPWMLERGRWIAEHPEITDIAGFHLNALYAPYGWKNSWAALAKRWVKLIHKRDRGQQQAFTNLVLAETWTEDQETVDKDSILNRRESYPADVPAGALVLTCAVDVQMDRLEAESYGWGIGDESWSVERRVFWGSPVQDAVWGQLTEWRTKTFTHETGIALKIEACTIDTGDGKHTREAYKYCRKFAGHGVYAIKGSSEPKAPLMAGATMNKLGRVKLYSIGTNAAKDTIFARLKLDQYGPGYIHHPITDQHDDEYFAQLTAESRVPKYDRGVLAGYVYKKNRTRNETLDLAVYNLVAHAIRNPRYEAILQKQKAQQEREQAMAVVVSQAPHDPPPKPERMPFRTPRGTGNWTTGWRR